MKTLTLISILLISQFLFASGDVPCTALVNGDEVALEKSAAGLYMIAIEDPHFDEYDVVIDLSSSGLVKVRLAKFIPTPIVAGLKEELTKVSENMRTEILKLAKARIVDGMVGYSSSGYASLLLNQGEDRLELICSRVQ